MTTIRVMDSGLAPSGASRLPRDDLESAAATADHGANRFIGTEIFGAIDIEQSAEFRSCTVDAAFDGADRAAADCRGVLIGEAGGAHQNQRFALVLGKFVEGGPEFLELEMRALRRLGFEGLGIAAIGILHLPPPLAVVRAEQVAQDREQPRRQIRAWLERVD